MKNVLFISKLRIVYNAELKLLERMVESALQNNKTLTSRAILMQSRKVDMLLRQLLIEDLL